MKARARRHTGAFRTHRAVFLLALLAYLPGFWWGAPHATAWDRSRAWGVDDELPLGPLGQLNDMLTPGLEEGENLGYPMLHSYLALATFTPYVGYLFATGGLSSPTAEYPYGFSDPVSALRNLSWLAHLLSVFLGAGIVLAAYVIGRTLWGERDGRWAAAFALLSFPMFYYARTSNVDVPAMFFVAWSLVALAGILAHGPTWRRVAAFGALAGLAVATKEPMAAMYLGVPVLLFIPHGTWRGFRDPIALVKAALLGVGSAVVAYALGSGMVIDPVRWTAHIQSGVERTSDVAQGVILFVNPYPRTLEGHWGLMREIMGRLRDTLTAPGLALAIVGIGLALRSRSRRSAWLFLTATTYILTLFLVVRAAHLRFVMPPGFVLSIFAGHAAAVLFSSSHAAVRRGGGVAVAAAVALASLWAIDLTHDMVRDSRYESGRWIASVGHPGDQIEYFGSFHKNPPIPANILTSRAIEYGGGEVDAPRDDATAERIRSGWRERQPRFIILIPDHTSRPGEPFPNSCPPQIYDDLEAGRLGYVQARLIESPPLIGFVGRPRLDYDAVDPPVRIYVPSDDPTVGRSTP